VTGANSPHWQKLPLPDPIDKIIFLLPPKAHLHAAPTHMKPLPTDNLSGTAILFGKRCMFSRVKEDDVPAARDYTG
jgi:hypothetical protein